MFQYGIVAEGLKVEHRHADGSWVTMEPQEVRDPAEVDPEREWNRGHVFVCPRCEESVRITPPADQPEGAAAG
jgi:hypothetical protein